uniref:BTB domain-containing protein n=1 Tax=Globodera rostochiensis TaxID=31243 RepID=A0A914HLC5_GLORO
MFYFFNLFPNFWWGKETKKSFCRHIKRFWSPSEEIKPVEVPDVEVDAFKAMLAFIYADDLSGLNGDNAISVLYAANKYNLPELVNSCLNFLWKLNVFFAFDEARFFGKKSSSLHRAPRVPSIHSMLRNLQAIGQAALKTCLHPVHLEVVGQLQQTYTQAYNNKTVAQHYCFNDFKNGSDRIEMASRNSMNCSIFMPRLPKKRIAARHLIVFIIYGRILMIMEH